MASSLRRLVLLVVALGVATALLVGAMSMLAPTAPANASPVLQVDQVGAVERGVTQAADEPASNRPASNRPASVPVVVLGGLVLLAALPPAHRVHVYYHRPPGSYWQ